MNPLQVLGSPPSTSSDLGLAEAVAAAGEGNISSSGIVVTFSPQSLVAQLEGRPEICAKMQVTFRKLAEFPVMSFSDKGSRESRCLDKEYFAAETSKTTCIKTL